MVEPDPTRTFRDVDDGETQRLVAMMDATDAWPAVQAARRWVWEQAAVAPGDLVVDVGAGPGTFGAAAPPGATVVDVDTSAAMLASARVRHPSAVVVEGDVASLPIADGSAALVRAERVLQWTDDPGAELVELVRIARPGGLVAVTDTDWGTFVVDHPDPTAARRLSSAALGWVPRPEMARGLPRLLADIGLAGLEVQVHAAVLSSWDPDDPAQRDGPLGLPIRTIALGTPPDHRDQALADVEDLAALARRGRFFASVGMVTVVGHR